MAISPATPRPALPAIFWWIIRTSRPVEAASASISAATCRGMGCASATERRDVFHVSTGSIRVFRDRFLTGYGPDRDAKKGLQRFSVPLLLASRDPRPPLRRRADGRRPKGLSDEAALRIGERLKTSGADIEAWVEAFAAETGSAAKAKPKAEGAAYSQPSLRRSLTCSRRRAPLHPEKRKSKLTRFLC